MRARQVTPSPDLRAAIQRALSGVAPARLLVVSDFDGTLAQIVPEAGDAKPLPGCLEALSELAHHVLQVVVLSGRSRRDLERVIPLEGVRLLGDYGLEHPSGEETEALRAFNAEAARLVERHPGARLETKPGSSSVHFRAAPEAGPALAREVGVLANRNGLRAHSGKMVVEVRPPRAQKRAAMERLLGNLEPDAAFYAGDDEGDRGVFELLAGLRSPHLAVGVASAEAAPGLFSDCDLVVEGPEQAVDFLSRLAEWSAAPGRGGRGSANSPSD
jgi:trehalose 6-phosphate phosphatase